jgi:hypothetical protein
MTSRRSDAEANIPENLDNLSILLPTAEQAMEKLALAEARKAAEAESHRAAAAAEKTALIEQLKKPVGVSDEELAKRAAVIIERAIENGLTEVQVFRFPSDLCTDHGRAINQQERGWETTLTGLPKELYQFWKRHLQPRGYKLQAQIVEFPDGVPGDVGLTLKWL